MQSSHGEQVANKLQEVREEIRQLKAKVKAVEDQAEADPELKLRRLAGLDEQLGALLRKEERLDAAEAAAAAAARSEMGVQAALAAPTRCKLPPEGAVLALHEVKADSTKETVGTLVIFTRSGKCLTALHCITLDGKVYPDALEAGGSKLQYLQGFPDDDVAVLQLPSSGPPNSGGGSAGSWPYVPAGSVSRGELDSTTPVLLMGYAQCVEQEGMLPENQPLVTHGRLSHTTANGRHCLADYTGFPNCSGGAVVCADTGNLLGIHVGEVSHSAQQPATQGKRKRKLQPPEVSKGRPSKLRQPVQRGAGAGRDLSQAVDSLQLRVARVEEESTSKGAVGYFVPCMRLQDVLEDAGVLQPTAEEQHLQQLSEGRLGATVAAQGAGLAPTAS